METTRDEIMENCPEDFYDTLKSFIDEIEIQVFEIKYCLEHTNKLNDLQDVEEALDLVKDLSDKLC